MQRVFFLILLILMTVNFLSALTCPGCNHENTEDSDFCTECGTRLRYALDVKTTPIDATLYINDGYIGKTPYKVDGLFIGTTYQIRIEHEGYETYKGTWSAKQNVYPDLLDINLKAISEKIAYEINTKPSGASLSIARNKVGITPVKGIYTTGTYQIELEKKGYDTLSKEIAFTKDGGNSFNFELEKTRSMGNPTMRHVLRYSALGLGALGIASYVWAFKKHQDYKDNTDPSKMDDLYDKANTQEGISLILLGTGAVALGVSFAF
jgi:hypothetical protein